MSMSQLQQTMATLRLGLAEIRHKEEQLDSMIAQFRTQLRRLPRQVLYGHTPLDSSLSALGEIEERLADAEAVRSRLLTIKKAALDELAVLESVKQVDDAKAKLAGLRRRLAANGEDPETLAEMRRLQQFIAEHSKRAEAAITESYQARVDAGRPNQQP